MKAMTSQHTATLKQRANEEGAEEIAAAIERDRKRNEKETAESL